MMEQDKQRRAKRASDTQKEYLINFLEENVDIANDKFVSVDGAKFRDNKWKKIALELNSLGVAQKDDHKWRKYWTDLRLCTKSKYSQIKRQQHRSGVNGLAKAKELSEFEERVIRIITLEAVDGDMSAELGFEEIVEQTLEPVFEEDGDLSIVDPEIVAVPTSIHDQYAQKETEKERRKKTQCRPKRNADMHLDLQTFAEIEEKKIKLLEVLVELKKEDIQIKKEMCNKLSDLCNSLRS